jgi:hypothetical protein
MALRWADPFEQYGGDASLMIQGPWAQIDTTLWSLSNTRARTGAWSLRLAGAGLQTHQIARRVIGNSLTEAKIGYALYCDSLPVSENPGDTGGSGSRIEILSFRDAANGVQLTFVLGTNGQVVAYRGGHSTLTGGWALDTFLARSDPTILVPARAFSHLEFKVKIDPVDGYIEVRLNQVTIMNLTGINTRYTANTETSQVAWAKEAIGGNGGLYYFDDIVCSDTLGGRNTDFIGDQKCFYLPPTSDGVNQDFTVSTAGPAYIVLSNVPPDDAQYLSLVATTGKTGVGCANLPGNTASVAGVFAMIRSWKDDAGVCDMKPGLKQGATFAAGPGQPQTTAPNYYMQPFEVDPVSGVPFTRDDVNSLELIVERAA